MSRIYTTEGYRRRRHGQTQVFRAGHFYRPDSPEELVEAGVAFFENDPPQCPHCDTVFTGTDAFQLKRTHIESEHYTKYLETIDRRQTLVQMCKVAGCPPSEIEGTGAEGRVLMEDMRRALVAEREEE